MILIATSLLDDLRLYDDGGAALIETHGEIERRNGGRAADDQDFGQRSAIDVVAGGTVNCTFTMVDVTFTSRFPHFYDGVL